MIALARSFVPAADEVWRLQNDDDPECRFFRSSVTGNTARFGGTLQGTYIFAPDGKLLERRNSNSATQILEIMERALARWRELPAERRRPTAENFRAQFRWENSYPADGLVLSRFARDLPVDGRPSSQPTKPYNQDAVWFSRAEARRWVPQSREIGSRRVVPAVSAERLAFVALADNVRGQTIPFHKTETSGTRLETQVTAVRDNLIDIRITGVTRANAKGPWLYEPNYWQPSRDWPRSVTTRVAGEATFDAKRGVFVAFRLVALGERRGQTGNNGRGRDTGPRGIGFALRLAPNGWRVAPTFINVYDVPWVEMPKR